MTRNKAFWEQKTLAELNQAEWEALCDGCGYCCLLKLEDEDDGSIYTTNVACRLLDTATCRCRDYPNRRKRVASCLVLQKEKTGIFNLLPDTCAYRCLHEGRSLPAWHPLISGTQDTVKQAGISVCGYAVSEQYIHPDQLQDHVIHRLRQAPDGVSGVKGWVVYILQCSDGSFYTGMTNDVERRLQEHNHGHKAARYTRGRRPVKLVYQQECGTRAEAARTEYRIRNLARSRKLQLISGYLSTVIN